MFRRSENPQQQAIVFTMTQTNQNKKHQNENKFRVKLSWPSRSGTIVKRKTKAHFDFIGALNKAFE